MATKRCPNCNLVNPGSAQSCDCGYSFATGDIGRPLDLSRPGEQLRSSGSDRFARFVIWIVLVIVLTIIKIAIRGH